MTIDPIDKEIYWASYEDDLIRVQRVNLNGSNPVDLYTVPDVGLRFIDSVELDVSARKIYWTESDFDTSTFRIRRSNLDGSGREEVLQTAGRASDFKLDTTRGRMYWGEQVPQFEMVVRSANLDGSDIRTLTEPIFPMNFAVDPPRSLIYLTNYGFSGLHVVPQTGGELTTRFETDAGPLDIDVDPQGGVLYWANSNANTIQKARVGTFATTPTRVLQLPNTPEAIALGPIPEPASWALALMVAGIALLHRQFARGKPRR
jgi:hypothetical protein